MSRPGAPGASDAKGRGGARAGRERDSPAGATRRDSVGRRGDADRGRGVDGRGEQVVMRPRVPRRTELGDERAFTCLRGKVNAPVAQTRGRASTASSSTMASFSTASTLGTSFATRRGRITRRAASASSSSRTPEKDESVVRDRQSLSFKDLATGVDVTLVGTMHYNPVSIELASSTVTRLRRG